LRAAPQRDEVVARAPPLASAQSNGPNREGGRGSTMQDLQKQHKKQKKNPKGEHLGKSTRALFFSFEAFRCSAYARKDEALKIVCRGHAGKGAVWR